MHRLAEQAHPAFPVTIYYAFKQSERTATTAPRALAGTHFSLRHPRRFRHHAELGRCARNCEQSTRRQSVQRPRLQHRPRLPSARGRRADRHAPRVRHRAQGRTARGARQPSARQHRAGGPRAGGHRPGHGGLHPLRQGARRRGQAAYGARGAGAHQPDPRRGAGRAGGRLRRGQPLGADMVRAVRLRRGRVGVAEQLSKSKNTSVEGMVEAGILESRRGKVRLLRPESCPPTGTRRPIRASPRGRSSTT